MPTWLCEIGVVSGPITKSISISVRLLYLRFIFAATGINKKIVTSSKKTFQCSKTLQGNTLYYVRKRKYIRP